MRLVAAIFALESTLTTARVCAQPSEPSPHTVAVDMFDAGDALMASGRVREACPKYAESYRLDPQLGALLHWADCLEQDGKFASAYAAFRDAAELAARSADQRREFALARVLSLEPRLSRVIIEAPRGALPPEAAVQLDSLRIVESGLGVGIAVDPGEHSVRASAPGFEPFSRTFTVNRQGQVLRFVLPALKLVSRSEPVVSSAAAPVLADRPASARRDAGRNWIGFGLTGAGIAAIGVGGVFFGRMLHRLEQRDELCPHSPCAPGTDPSRVRSLENEARTAEAWALGLSLGGVVAAAAGAVLYLSAPRSRLTLGAWSRPSAPSGLLQGLEWRF
jgi:hypothetical protein